MDSDRYDRTLYRLRFVFQSPDSMLCTSRRGRTVRNTNFCSTDTGLAHVAVVKGQAGKSKKGFEKDPGMRKRRKMCLRVPRDNPIRVEIDKIR